MSFSHVTSRAALVQRACQRAMLPLRPLYGTAAPEGPVASGADPKKPQPPRETDRSDEKGSKGAGRKSNVQQDADDQKGAPAPKEGGSRGAP